MREIKFRVWNGSQMVYDVTVGKFGTFYVNRGEKGNGLDPKDSASLTPFNTRFSDDTPVMQFTGLKDKNGVDIYEGDIMNVRQRTIGKGDKTKYKDFNVPVEYYNGAFVLPFENYGEYRFRDGDLNHFEVIGNIFETPELLSTPLTQTIPSVSNTVTNTEEK